MQIVSMLDTFHRGNFISRHEKLRVRSTYFRDSKPSLQGFIDANMARDLPHSYLLLKREAYHGSPNCRSIETKYIAPIEVGKEMSFGLKVLFRN